MTYFNSCKNLDEVKSLYRSLSKANHPDMGGDTATMQAINTEYSFACAKLLAGGSLSAEEIETEILNCEAYRNAVAAVAILPGIVVEVVGSWIWISGNTYPVKNTIKEAGFLFASSKKMWFFCTDENKCANYRKTSIDEIRNKYGSQTVNTNQFQKRAIA